MLCFLFVSISVSGCSTKTKTEKEIKEDILKELNSQVKDSRWEINKFQVERRDTNKKNKTDTIWASALLKGILTRDGTDIAKTETEREIVIEYYRYNEGWQLEDCYNQNHPERGIVERCFYEPMKSYITQSDVDEKLLEEKYENFDFVSRGESQDEPGIDMFYYKMTEVLGLRSIMYELKVKYEFDASHAYWSCSDIVKTKTEDTIDGIVGVWRYRGENEKELYINIVSIDLMNETIEMEYNLKNYAYNRWYKFYYNTESDGVETFDLTEDLNGGIRVITKNSDFTIYIEPQKIERWASADEGQGVLLSAASAVWLEKE